MTRTPWLADVAEQVDPFHSRESRNQAHRECWRKTRFYREQDARRAARKARQRQENG